jgi:hypothetical protein
MDDLELRALFDTSEFKEGIAEIGESLHKMTADFLSSASEITDSEDTVLASLGPNLVAALSPSAEALNAVGESVSGMLREFGVLDDEASNTAVALASIGTGASAAVGGETALSTALDDLFSSLSETGGLLEGVVVPANTKLAVALDALFEPLTAVASGFETLTPLENEFSAALDRVFASLNAVTDETANVASSETLLSGALDQLLNPLVAVDNAVKDVGISFDRLESTAGGVQGILEGMSGLFSDSAESLLKTQVAAEASAEGLAKVETAERRLAEATAARKEIQDRISSAPTSAIGNAQEAPSSITATQDELIVAYREEAEALRQVKEVKADIIQITATEDASLQSLSQYITQLQNSYTQEATAAIKASIAATALEDAQRNGLATSRQVVAAQNDEIAAYERERETLQSLIAAKEAYAAGGVGATGAAAVVPTADTSQLDVFSAKASELQQEITGLKESLASLTPAFEAVGESANEAAGQLALFAGEANVSTTPLTEGLQDANGQLPLFTSNIADANGQLGLFEIQSSAAAAAEAAYEASLGEGSAAQNAFNISIGQGVIVTEKMQAAIDYLTNAEAVSEGGALNLATAKRLLAQEAQKAGLSIKELGNEISLTKIKSDAARAAISQLDQLLGNLAGRGVAEELGLGRLSYALGLLGRSLAPLNAIFVAAFPIIGVALAIQVIQDLIDKIRLAGDETRKNILSFTDLSASATVAAESLELVNLRLDDQIAKLEGGPASNQLAEALIENRIEADKLTKSVGDTLEKITELIEKADIGVIPAFFKGEAPSSVAFDLGSKYDDLKTKIDLASAALGSYREAQADVDTQAEKVNAAIQSGNTNAIASAVAVAAVKKQTAADALAAANAAQTDAVKAGQTAKDQLDTEKAARIKSLETPQYAPGGGYAPAIQKPALSSTDAIKEANTEYVHQEAVINNTTAALKEQRIAQDEGARADVKRLKEAADAKATADYAALKEQRTPEIKSGATDEEKEAARIRSTAAANLALQEATIKKEVEDAQLAGRSKAAAEEQGAREVAAAKETARQQDLAAEQISYETKKKSTEQEIALAQQNPDQGKKAAELLTLNTQLEQIEKDHTTAVATIDAKSKTDQLNAEAEVDKQLIAERTKQTNELVTVASEETRALIDEQKRAASEQLQQVTTGEQEKLVAINESEKLHFDSVRQAAAERQAALEDERAAANVIYEKEKDDIETQQASLALLSGQLPEGSPGIEKLQSQLDKLAQSLRTVTEEQDKFNQKIREQESLASGKSWDEQYQALSNFTNQATGAFNGFVGQIITSNQRISVDFYHMTLQLENDFFQMLLKMVEQLPFFTSIQHEVQNIIQGAFSKLGLGPPVAGPGEVPSITPGLTQQVVGSGTTTDTAAQQAQTEAIEAGIPPIQQLATSAEYAANTLEAQKFTGIGGAEVASPLTPIEARFGSGIAAEGNLPAIEAPLGTGATDIDSQLRGEQSAITAGFQVQHVPPGTSGLIPPGGTAAANDQAKITAEQTNTTAIQQLNSSIQTKTQTTTPTAATNAPPAPSAVTATEGGATQSAGASQFTSVLQSTVVALQQFNLALQRAVSTLTQLNTSTQTATTSQSTHTATVNNSSVAHQINTPSVQQSTVANTLNTGTTNTNTTSTILNTGTQNANTTSTLINTGITNTDTVSTIGNVAVTNTDTATTAVHAASTTADTGATHAHSASLFTSIGAIFTHTAAVIHDTAVSIGHAAAVTASTIAHVLHAVFVHLSSAAHALHLGTVLADTAAIITHTAEVLADVIALIIHAIVALFTSGHAEGGLIQGAGTGTSDSIPSLLSHGEYVIQAESVGKPGMLNLLHAINAGNIGAEHFSNESHDSIASKATAEKSNAAQFIDHSSATRSVSRLETQASLAGTFSAMGYTGKTIKAASGGFVGPTGVYHDDILLPTSFNVNLKNVVSPEHNEDTTDGRIGATVQNERVASVATSANSVAATAANLTSGKGGKPQDNDTIPESLVAHTEKNIRNIGNALNLQTTQTARGIQTSLNEGLFVPTFMGASGITPTTRLASNIASTASALKTDVHNTFDSPQHTTVAPVVHFHGGDVQALDGEGVGAILARNHKHVSKIVEGAVRRGLINPKDFLKHS